MPHISLFVIGASHITVNKQHTVVEKLTKILFALKKKDHKPNKNCYFAILEDNKLK